MFYVLFAGAVAAIGWTTMVAYAVATEGADITRNYVQYLTSNSILLGAEFDKIVSILMVTAVLAVSIGRGRGLLERAVAEGAAARDLSRFLAPEVAQQIRISEHHIQPGHGEIREAAVLFLDIRGFTPRAAALPPTEVMRLLANYQSRAAAAVRRHGGSIDKFLGDGILVTFGAAEPSGTYAADALSAADAVVAAIDAWNAERIEAGLPVVVVNGAVTCGPVLFGAVGDDSRLEYTVIGDPVNLAAKLEKHNKTLGTVALTTESCHRLAREQGYRGTGTTLAAQRVAEETIDLVVIARAA